MANQHDNAKQTGTPRKPPRPSVIVRILRALERQQDRADSRNKKAPSEHQHNERMMARWTRRVGVFTAILVASAIASDFIFWFQLHEMQSSGADTHLLAVATNNTATTEQRLETDTSALAAATNNLRQAAEDQAAAAKSQSTAMDRLRQAGEAQAHAAAALAEAGHSQAGSTADLAKATGQQLAAIQAQADAAKAQAGAVSRQADATIAASKATDRLASAGQAQSDSIRESLGVARDANRIAADASYETTRPWVGLSSVSAGGPAVAQDFTATFAFTNSGHSPALRLREIVTISVYSEAERFNLPDIAICDPTICSQSTVLPNGGLGFSITMPKTEFTKDEIDKISSHKDFIIAQFRIEYSDAQGRNHVTVGCEFYNAADSGFTACLRGNDAN